MDKPNFIYVMKAPTEKLEDYEKDRITKKVKKRTQISS